MAESFEEAPSESWAQPGSTTRAKVRDDRRLRWLVAAGLLFAVSTFLALSQPPWPYPYDPPRTFGFDWWLHPIEQNAARRLPLVSSEINAVWISDDGERMWAVGDDGLVLRSDDGGESWQRVEIGIRTTGESPSGSAWSLPGWPVVAAQQNATPDFVQPRGPLRSIWFEELQIAWQDTSPFELADDLPPIDLHAVTFRDEAHGWIGGSDGYLLRTEDGGESWQRRRLPKVDPPVAQDTPSSASVSEPASVVALAFPQSTLGCAVLTFRAVTLPPIDGSNPVTEMFVLASSADEGMSWRPLTIVDSSRLISRGNECWALDANGLLIVDSAVGDDQQSERRPLPSGLLDRSVDAGGDSQGMVLIDPTEVSRNAAFSWHRAMREPEVGHHSLHFFDRRRGVAATQHLDGSSSIQQTEDGGRSWLPTIPTLAPAHLDFFNESIGWAMSVSNEQLASKDGGQTWTPGSADINGVEVSLSGHYARFSRDFDKGITLPFSRMSRLREVAPETYVVDVIGGPGGIFQVEFRRDSFYILPIDNRHRPGARSIDRVDDRLWVGGWNGLYIVGEEADEQVTDRPVFSFFFLDRQTGWIAEPGGGLLFTEDGGITWTDLTPYRIYPAPWYWLACCVSLLLLTPAFRKPPTQEVHRSVAEMAVSDRPIEAGDPDPLDFGQVALGLSRFLRNSATQPPLTLAVTGKWGTGKSSLMNLLRADLADYGFRPVWFNAWHHQKEEQLLAALLVNIRRQAIPSLLSPEGWAFRGRLLKRRMRRWRLLTLLLTLGFGLLTGWVATSSEGAGLMTRVWETLEKLNPAAWLAPNGEAVEPGMAALLVAAAAVLFTVGRGLRAFGVDPGTLVTGLSSRASRRDARAQAGFRHRFAREFEDVTRALRPRTLTLLIDDLDRCRPQNVLDVLEAVNFLVSSGRCYVVLGIDREMVERFVGYGFREVADEILDRDETPAEEGDDEAAARARRAAFARQYLEKLINIEVAVPRVEEAAGRHLVRPPEPKAERPGRWQRLADWFRSLPGRWWALPAVIAVTLIAGLWLGSWFGTEPAPVVAETPAEEAVTVEPLAEPEVPDEATVLSEETAAPETPDEEEIATGPPARLIPGEEGDRHHFWFWLAVVVLLGGATTWVLTTLPQVEVHDSPEFVEALDAWFPLLHAETPTPRSIKRFLNRVRCYAMRQRPAEPPRSRWGAVGDWFRGLVGKPQETDDDLLERPDQIPERALVALAAIEHLYPHLLGDLDFWMDPWNKQVTEDREGHSLSIAEIVGSNLPEIHPYRRAFAGLSRGIETH